MRLSPLFLSLLLAASAVAQTFTLPSGPAYPRQNAPSSRRTPLVFSEIMYHPPAPEGDELEFVEIYNSEPVAYDLTGHTLSGGIGYAFADGTTLAAKSRLVVAFNPALVQSKYGISGVLGPFTGHLANGGDTVRLKNARGSVLLEVNFSDHAPWPVGADGDGSSLVLAQPDFGEDDARAWVASAGVHGNPGAPDPTLTSPLLNVRINEVLSRPNGGSGFVELYNYSAASVDVSGCVLTDSATGTPYLIPNGTSIPAHGQLQIPAASLAFLLPVAGGRVALLSPDRTLLLDAQKFDAAGLGQASGRVPNGIGDWRTLTAPTPGAANSGAFIASVVINEIMFHPISENDLDTYVELTNRSAAAVNVGGWKFTAGISFTLPAGTTIASGGYLVIAADAVHLRAIYPNLNATNCLGNFTGKLGHGGDRITLAQPDGANFVTVNSVRYRDGSDWGKWADGNGSSLELRDAHSDNALAMNWAGSDETAKAPWSNIEVTGSIADALVSPANRLYVYLLDGGECLLDDVEVHIGAGANLVQNPSFDANATGWAVWGNLFATTRDATGGMGNTGCFHLREQEAGSVVGDKLIATLTSGVANTNTVTIRAKVRWLAGSPRIVLPLKGTGLELSAALPVPANLGTPGAANSRALANAGPALSELQHSPVLPAAAQSVVVTARAADPDGVASFTLNWKLEAGTTYTQVAMNDAGTGGDAHAGDGIFSGTIPGQASGAMIAFYVDASDGAANNTLPLDSFSNSVRALIRWGEPVQGGDFGNYHLWVRSGDLAAWDADPTFANHLWPMTLAVDGYRAIYGCGVRFRGSTYTRQNFTNPFTGNQCGYAFGLPDGSPFLGTGKFNLDSTNHFQSLNNSLVLDGTWQRSRLTYAVGNHMGVPTHYARYIHVFGNGTQRGQLFADAQSPTGDYLKEHFPGADDGYLHESVKYSEWDDNIASEFATSGERLGPFSNVKKVAGAYRNGYYRPIWERKSNGPRDDSFANLFRLYDVMNATVDDSQIAAFLALVDVDEFTATMGMRHISTDQDGFAYDDLANGFIYKPLQGKWKHVPWDFDTGWGVSRTATDPIPPAANMQNQDAKLYSFLTRPVVLRAYWRAVKRGNDWLANGAQANLAAWNAVLTAPANGVTNVQDFSTLQTFVTNRTAFISTAITNANLSPAFAITTNSGNNFSTAVQLVTLTGTAPFTVDSLRVNGQPVQVKWTDVRTWRFQYGIAPGANLFTVTGLDPAGVPLASAAIMITFTGAAVTPGANVVINELMPVPALPQAEFIELFNRSTTTDYDLGGCTIPAVNYTFPAGTVILRNSYLVIAQDTAGYADAYGTAQIAKLAGAYSGRLDGGAENVTLLAPDGVTVLDRVAYETAAPWPQAGWDGTGQSFQLVDATADNSRVYAWKAAIATPGAANTAVATVLPMLGSLNFSEVQTANLNTIADNAGDFDPWAEILNVGAAANFNGCYLTDDFSALTKWAFPAGIAVANGARQLVWGDGEGGESSPPANPHTSNFSLNPAGGVLALVQVSGATTAILSYVKYPALPAGTSYGISPNLDGAAFQISSQPTPGAPNAGSLAGALKINEWMPSNTTTIADPADGDFDDWIEIYNTGTSTIYLSGCTLTDDPAKPGQWTFPAGTSIAPHGFLLVWADDETAQPGLHASFKLSATGEQILLFDPNGALLDSVTFGALANNISQGRVPDGGATIATFTVPSPNASNFTVNRWRTLHGLATNGAQDLANPSGDGLANLLKFALNLAPNPGDLAQPNSHALLDANGASVAALTGLPMLGFDGAARGVFTFIRRKASTFPGIGYVVEWSDDLATWSANSSATETTLSLDATWERVQCTDSFTNSQKTNRYARLRITAL